MGCDLDMIMHLNVTMPDGTEENVMQWKFEKYAWNVTLDVKGLVIYVHLQQSWVENIKLLYCNFCDQGYDLDMELYKQIFNTVLMPETLVLKTFFNPALRAKPIVWPAEMLGIAAMTNLEFHYFDGYMYMGSDMSWIPFPIAWKKLAKLPLPSEDHSKDVHM